MSDTGDLEQFEKALGLGPRRQVSRSKRSRKANPETIIQRAILDAVLRSSEVVNAWRNNTAVVRTESGSVIKTGQVGSADIIGMLKGGRMFCIEVKVPGKRATAKQDGWLAKMWDGGAVVGVAHDVAEALEIIEAGEA